MNDVTFRIALTRMMMENLDSMIMDVETAFLYGDLDEEIYMEVPLGLDEVYPNSINENETCFLLNGNLWFISSSKTILDKICSRNEQIGL